LIESFMVRTLHADTKCTPRMRPHSTRASGCGAVSNSRILCILQTASEMHLIRKCNHNCDHALEFDVDQQY